jgi:hypothetical protein
LLKPPPVSRLPTIVRRPEAPFSSINSFGQPASVIVRQLARPFHLAHDEEEGEVFQVYNFEMSCIRKPSHETAMKFYLVPLGAYFKPRRQTRSREIILREYALEALKAFRNAIPFD